jgi:phosphoenolpyruvate carboxylase
MPNAPSRRWWASATTCPPTERRADNEALIRARVTQLWQTRMLRLAKLTVADEVENALSYYASTFLREIPRLYRDLERALPGHPVASFLRMGHWIGGDRDGNPNVTPAHCATRYRARPKWRCAFT